MRNTTAIIEDGMKCLVKHLGSYETEIFIWNLLKEPFDYTEWQKTHFSNITLEKFNADAAEYDRQHPWTIGRGSND